MEDFNFGDSEALGARYTQNATLKLPGALALNGRTAIAQAWQQGFDGGLDFLQLTVEAFDQVGNRRVLETGTYELSIQTPDGPILQTGTYAVLWKVPENPNRNPKIIFDTIDAN